LASLVAASDTFLSHLFRALPSGLPSHALLLNQRIEFFLGEQHFVTYLIAVGDQSRLDLQCDQRALTPSASASSARL
jgi:hypothetical protein